MKRFGMTIRLRPESEEKYKELHAAVWPDVLAQIARCNIRNYSIFLHAGVLFGYLEYTGANFKEDMAKMAEDPATQKWWSLTDPMQEALPTRQEGDWWALMEEVFHAD